MVAERFVFLRKCIVIYIGKIKNENIDMSSDKRMSYYFSENKCNKSTSS